MVNKVLNLFGSLRSKRRYTYDEIVWGGRKNRHAKRRKDEITPCEKTKRRQAKRRKETTRKADKTRVSNGVFLHGFFFFFFFSSFRAEISSFRVAGFVFSHGVISYFRLAFFRLFAWHLFVWRLFAAKRRKDEMAQTSHHAMLCKSTPEVLTPSERTL